MSGLQKDDIFGKYFVKIVSEIDCCTACEYSVCNECWYNTKWYKEACGYCDHNQCNYCPKYQNHLAAATNCCTRFHCTDCNNVEEPDPNCPGIHMQPIGWWDRMSRKKSKDTTF
jgi:hypothetical protein